MGTARPRQRVEGAETATPPVHPDPESHQSAGVPASLLDYLHACPICSHTDLRHYCRVPSRFNAGEFICYERCGRCGTVLRNPRLPAAYRLDRYEEQAFGAEQRELRQKAQLHYWYMVRVLTRLLPAGSGRRFLDFGCGAGGFLVEARQAGFEVMGLELNRDLAGHVSSHYGIPVFQGLVSDAGFSKEKFDIIVSSQVFEHLLDPRETLAELREHLRSPGLLLIEVPNLRDFRERLSRGSTMDDSHLFYFSRRSLGWLLRDGGFHVLRVEEGLRPYGLIGRVARHLPLPLLAAAEKLASACQLKTVLSVVAALG